MFDPSPILAFIRELHGSEEIIPLHAPRFIGEEQEFVRRCIESTFVSSVGEFVNEFEETVARYTGAGHAVAVVNGTQALFVALLLAGTKPGDMIITQSLTFVATANAITYAGALPAFVDVDRNSLGMCPVALREFLQTQCDDSSGRTTHCDTGATVRAIVPMHSLGHACGIAEIQRICEEYNLALIEDAAESLGTFYTQNGESKHTGRFGSVGTLSFNGNKIITTGGGGMLLTDDSELSQRARHLTTTAKKPHPYEFIHDKIGYNFRMPNLNAALGLAQMQSLPRLLAGQKVLADAYRQFFSHRKDAQWIEAPPDSQSNFWLNACRVRNIVERDLFLESASREEIGARAIWRPMHMLSMFDKCARGEMTETESAYETVVNLPSTVPMGMLAAA